jgi:NADPH2:quinone reductase
MRAALYEKLGPADVIRLGEIPRPEPATGEVRVKVVLSGVNPTDWKSRSAGPGKEMAYPYVVPNQDGAGVIDAVGSEVSEARLGERVWLYLAQWQRQQGTAAEWICLPSERVVSLPAEASFELGASLGVPALTAAHALFADGPLAGKHVLVSGGAGAVAHFAIELARFRGARVLTTVSSKEKADLAREAGADVVVNYREEDAAASLREAAPAGLERIVEVAPSNVRLDAEVLAPHGTVVMYASTDEDPPLPVRALMGPNATLRFMLLYTLTGQQLRKAVSEVSAALDAGALSELPVHRFPLEETAAAHGAVEQGAVGKVVVEP